MRAFRYARAPRRKTATAASVQTLTHSEASMQEQASTQEQAARTTARTRIQQAEEMWQRADREASLHWTGLVLEASNGHLRRLSQNEHLSFLEALIVDAVTPRTSCVSFVVS
jgi:hypothetical protein